MYIVYTYRICRNIGRTGIFGERERANLVIQLARFFYMYNFNYIYIYGRALHIPYISKCFYVNFLNRNHRVQRSTSYYQRAACTYRNVLRISKSANLCTEPREICVLMASPTQTH